MPEHAELTGEQLFQSKRMLCRRWQPTDLDTIFAVYSDEEGSRWVDDGTPITFAECEGWLDVTAKNYRERGYGMFSLEHLESGEVIGFIGLVHPGGQEEAEIKYAFLKSYWGQGLASEIVPATLKHGAKAHGLGKIIATVAAGNIPSQRVLAKSGMTFIREYEDDDERVQLFEWNAES